jgi:hypothetical protein
MEAFPTVVRVPAAGTVGYAYRKENRLVKKTWLWRFPVPVFFCAKAPPEEGNRLNIP